MANPLIHRFKCRACGGSYSDTQPDGSEYAHVCGPLPADKKNPERERPDKRDENIVVGAGGKALGIKSEGAGVRCLTSDSLYEPQWIFKLKVRTRKQEEKENA